MSSVPPSKEQKIMLSIARNIGWEDWGKKFFLNLNHMQTL